MEIITQEISKNELEKQDKLRKNIQQLSVVERDCNSIFSKLSQKELLRNLKFISKFLARLTESQREFSEQLGLPYTRVFSDGYEDFKGKQTDEVILSWLMSGTNDQVRLTRLLNDVCKHQLALVASTDGVVEHAIDTIQSKTTGIFNRDIKSYCIGIKESPEQRFNEFVAPGLARAYIGQRERQQSIK